KQKVVQRRTILQPQDIREMLVEHREVDRKHFIEPEFLFAEMIHAEQECEESHTYHPHHRHQRTSSRNMRHVVTARHGTAAGDRGAALTEQSVRTIHPSKYAKSAIAPPILGVREEIFYR